MFVTSESKTKIIATIGPSSDNKETLRKMIEEGLDVCRLNFSHGSHEDHESVINIIKALNVELDAGVAILADLQGPKLRIGEVENNEIELEDGKIVDFVTTKCLGTQEKVYMNYKEFPCEVEPGEIVLIDDGKLKLEVMETNRKDKVSLKVVNGGVLRSKKGANLPNTKTSLPSLTDKDIKDLHFALDQEVDWIALSFVRKADDILALKKIIADRGKNVGVIAKIEKPEAVDAFDDILEHADGIMIARGDLGIETPFDKVPVLQKKLVRKCITHAKPVIIATQMMESMITNFLPTRAEATDVSNAVLDGADAVMLSGETAMGKYPVEVIVNMQKVIDATEASGFYLNHEYTPVKSSPTYLPDSICYNACKMADQTDATGIVVFTFTGRTAVKISSHRPMARIFAFVVDKKVMRQLSVVRGVQTFVIEPELNINDAIDRATEILKVQQMVNKGDKLVFVGGIPMPKREKVNMLKISTV